MFGVLVVLGLAAVGVQSQLETLRRAPKPFIPPFIRNDSANLSEANNERLDRFVNRPGRRFMLCTYNNESYNKCQALLLAASLKSIALNLNCVQQANRDACLSTVRQGRTDFVVLGQNDYQVARQAKLKPVLFAREEQTSHYIAVVARSITIVQFSQAQLEVNVHDEGALHAAVAINLLRGRDTCPGLSFVAANEPVIRILNSAEYQSSAEDILVCPLGIFAETDEVTTCNFDVGLQRAVFVSPATKPQRLHQLHQTLDKILENFNANSSQGYNFFADDVIFKHNTIAIDDKPTYRNFVTENIFNLLRCNRPNENANDQRSGADIMQVSGFTRALKGVGKVLECAL